VIRIWDCGGFGVCIFIDIIDNLCWYIYIYI
jgi:hypothetical protein